MNNPLQQMNLLHDKHLSRPDRRWLALVVLCLGILMIALDTTIVNVALPSIKVDLTFGNAELAWVVNAYLLTYGGFLLLGGRLGDLYGHGRLFLIGMAIFVLASLACGLATTHAVLVIARAIQGVGAAAATAVTLSLIVDLFPDHRDRAKAMGVYGFVGAGGGSVGAMLGGVLTSSLSWHWVFLVNLPIGVAVILASLRLLPRAKGVAAQRLDAWGALTGTAALMLAVNAIVHGNEAGWTSPVILCQLATSVLLLVIFLRIEANVREPLIPLRMFRLRNLVISTVVCALWAAAMFAWLFLAALYMQFVLGYGPMKVGLAFIPTDLITAIFSLGLSAKVATRFGVKRPITFGLALVACGLFLFAHAARDGDFLRNILPGLILMGMGGGIAFNPLLLVATSAVDASESGLASGVVNTAFMMGGSLGMATLAAIAAWRTENLTLAGAGRELALAGGYQCAFFFGAGLAGLGAILAATCLQTSEAPLAEQPATH